MIASAPTRPFTQPHGYIGRQKEVDWPMRTLAEVAAAFPRLRRIVFDLHRSLPAAEPQAFEGLLAEAERSHFRRAWHVLNGHSCGSVLSQDRLILVLERGGEGGTVPSAPHPSLTPNRSLPLRMYLAPPEEVPPEAWADGKFEPAVESYASGLSHVRRAGFINSEGRRHAVISCDGAARPLKAGGHGALGSGAQLILDDRGPAGDGKAHPRTLTARECWSLAGLPPHLLEDWQAYADVALLPQPTEASTRKIAGSTTVRPIWLTALRWALLAHAGDPPPEPDPLRVGLSEGALDLRLLRVGEPALPPRWDRVGSERRGPSRGGTPPRPVDEPPHVAPLRPHHQ